jgi:hypothetical protein
MSTLNTTNQILLVGDESSSVTDDLIVDQIGKTVAISLIGIKSFIPKGIAALRTI